MLEHSYVLATIVSLTFVLHISKPLPPWIQSPSSSLQAGEPGTNGLLLIQAFLIDAGML